MTDTSITKIRSNNNSQWKNLPSLVSVNEAGSLVRNRNTTLKPSYYVDINGKEWIVIMRPTLRQQLVLTPHYDSFLYDIKANKYLPFIKNCETDINQRFDICHTIAKRRGHVSTCTSYTIDNENHVLYWLESEHYNNMSQTSLVAINIKDLNNLKLIHQKIISQDEFPLFVNRVWTMFVIGNTIEFILGGNNDYNDGKAHFEYDIELKKLKMLDKNILLPNTSRVTRSKVYDLFENLKVNDWIDARDDYGTFYLAQVLGIKDKEFVIEKEKEKNKENGNDNKYKLKSMKILVHYNGCSSKYDEWIHVSTGILSEKEDVTSELAETSKEISLSSLCDCIDKCHFLNEKYYPRRNEWSKFEPIEAQFSQFHRIGLPKTQSLCNQYLNEFNGIYSKSHQKMIIFGHNDAFTSNDKCCGVYYKHKMCYDKKQCQLIVFGFCHQSENHNNNNKKLVIPKEIRQLILKYYTGASDDEEWQNVYKKDKNGTILGDMFDDAFYLHCGFVLANNDNDIFIFGGKVSKYRKGGQTGFKHLNNIFKFNISANQLVRLTDIQCPEYSDADKVDSWHAVLCQKTKQVHLFAKTFCQHFCISLETLNSSRSELIDNSLRV